MTAPALVARDTLGSPFTVGDSVYVRGTVTAIVSATGLTTGIGVGGAADSVTVSVDYVGNAGEKKGVTVVVSPAQCRRAQAAVQNGPAVGPNLN